RCRALAFSFSAAFLHLRASSLSGWPCAFFSSFSANACSISFEANHEVHPSTNQDASAAGSERSAGGVVCEASSAYRSNFMLLLHGLLLDARGSYYR